MMQTQSGYMYSYEFLHSLERLESQMSNSGCISFKDMLAFLLEVQIALELPNLFDREVDNSLPLSIYTRMATVISWWLMSQDKTPTIDELTELAGRKQLVISIFHASGFAGTSHLQLYLSKKDGDGNNILSADRLILLLAVSSLDELSDELFNATFELAPEYIVTLVLGWLNSTVVLTLKGEEHRTRLIRMSGFLSTVKADREFMDLFLNCWMYCSYALTPDKHQLKKNVNLMVKQYLTSVSVKPEVAIYDPSQKPVMLVIMERFLASSAMYRCFRPYIESLKKHFTLVAIVEEQNIDEASRDLFTEIIKVDNVFPKIDDLINHVNRIKPQAVYYPSLGMCRWTIILCNLRLAPVQFMSLGHPATSYSDEIDYAFTMPMDESQYGVYFERLIFSQNDKFRQSPHPLLNEAKKKVRKFNDDCVHIAVNCTAMKLNGMFLEMCKKIMQGSEQKVQFHFFPGVLGYHYDGIRTMIRKSIPSAYVYPHVTYDQFLPLLGGCSLSLATFPFGNANSTADALILGIPVVCMTGPEPASRSDEYIIKSLGAPEYLICDSEEAYVEIVLRLLNDRDFYKKTSELINSIPVEDIIFNNQSNNNCESTGWIFSFAYHYNKQISGSNAKAIRYQDVSSVTLPEWD